MIFSRVWAMPSRWTFDIKPIRELLGRYSVGGGWIDPFCGKSEIAQWRNDLNPKNDSANHHLEAIDFINLQDWPIVGAIFDPPYSLTQVSKSYNEIGLSFKGKENPTGGFPQVKDRIAALLPTDGICISFGWNTIGLGKGRGMEIVEIMDVCHGGNRNDTLVTVEKKL